LVGTITRLDQFFDQREIQLYSRERFVRSSSRKNPLVQIDYSAFLDEKHRFKQHIFSFVRQHIQEFGLKVYFVIASWWGRGDQALWTGRHLFNTLNAFRRQGLCELILSYQEGELRPSKLCRWCWRRNIEVFYADRYQLTSHDSGEVIIPKKAPGKAENVIKSIKWIEKATKKKNIPPEKVLVIFIDDDYTQYHWLNYFLLFAPWILAFKNRINDPEIDPIIGQIHKVSFIKSGSPRIILPYEIQDQIIAGRMKPMDYLDVTLSIIDLASTHRRFGFSPETAEINELVSLLQKIRRRRQIYAPDNREHFLGESLNQRLESIWGEYIYRGGRVTQRLEGIFRHLSHNSHCRWLRQFTFLLHGDQGASLDSWLEFSPFGGYALEISLLMQTVCDKAFEGQQILNVVSLPHSHQRSKDLDIWCMLDVILLAFDLNRVLYKDLSVRNFLSMYKLKRYFPMLDRYGRVIKHTPQYGGLKIYPPLKSLVIHE